MHNPLISVFSADSEPEPHLSSDAFCTQKMSENTASKATELRVARNELSLFPNFKFPFPFLKPKGGSDTEGDKAKEEVIPEMEAPKPLMVRFPKAKVAVPPPEVAENHETGKTSNPIILWQVYALGGFLVLRWFWARWNERKGQNEDSPDNEPNPDE